MHSEAPWELPAHRFNPLTILDPKSMSFASDALSDVSAYGTDLMFS
jgi:hypothetical protein